VKAAVFALALIAAGAAYAAAPAGSAATLDPNYAPFIRDGALTGPAKIALRDEATLDLPDSYAFLPEKPGRDFMTRIGNTTDKNFLGLVIPDKMNNWFVMMEFIPDGYVKDDDAKDWKADDLLAGIRQNTDKENEQRRAKNVPELDIVGWIEKPHYDKANHRLIWSIVARNKGATDNGHQIINYRTLALGRNGYIAMVMVTDLDTIATQKPIATTLLSRLSFNSGKRYADFDVSTDKVAEYGLAALIGGLAVKKLGLFALIAAFLLKGAKLIAVAALGGLAWFRRLFRRRAQALPPNEPVVTPPGDGPFSK
jgi:uncharacterized membrane-anchored protein